MKTNTLKVLFEVCFDRENQRATSDEAGFVQQYRSPLTDPVDRLEDAAEQFMRNGGNHCDETEVLFIQDGDGPWVKVEAIAIFRMSVVETLAPRTRRPRVAQAGVSDASAAE